MRLDQEGPLEKEMATHSSILAWDNPMDSRACWAIVHGIKEESDTTWRLNNKWGFIYLFIYLQLRIC